MSTPPPKTTRRAALGKLALAALAGAGLFARPRRANAIAASKDTTLSGLSTVPSGSELVIKSGATIRAETGATIIGLGDGGGGVVPEEIYPRFAIFDIPIGINDPQFTDFEIKGSINNFGESPFGGPPLCYFYGSQYGNNVGPNHGARIGLTKTVYFTDSQWGGSHDIARRWRIQLPTKSILQMRASDSSVIGGATVVVPALHLPSAGAGGSGLPSDNYRLSFVYQRVSPTAMEENWVPITPRWVFQDPILDPGWAKDPQTHTFTAPALPLGGTPAKSFVRIFLCSKDPTIFTLEIDFSFAGIEGEVVVLVGKQDSENTNPNPGNYTHKIQAAGHYFLPCSLVGGTHFIDIGYAQTTPTSTSATLILKPGFGDPRISSIAYVGPVQ
jgi:hypothetical protein